MNRYKKLIQNSLLFTVGGFASKLLVFFLVPIYTNVLSTSEYGIIDLLQSTVNIVLPVFSLSISDATLRFVFDKEIPKEKVLSNSILIITTSTIVLILVSGLLKNTLSILFPEEHIPYFVAIYCVNLLHQCFANYAKAVGHTKLYTVQGVLQTLILISCNIVLLLVFEKGVYGFYWSLIISALVTVIFMLFVGHYSKHIRISAVDFSLLKCMLHFSIPLIPTTVAWWLNTSADKYMIKWMLSTELNGLYGVAHKIPTILTTIVSFFSSAWLLSSIETKEDEDYEIYFSAVYSTINSVGIIATYLLIIMSMPVGYVLFADEFFEAWRITPLLVVSSLFSSLCGILGAYFTAQKKTKVLFHSTGVGAIINIVLNFFFIRWFGVYGAATATVVSFVGVLIVRTISIRRVMNLQIKNKCIYFMYVVLFLLALNMAYNPEVGYCVSLFAGIAIMFVLRKDIHKILVMVLRKIIKKE